MTLDSQHIDDLKTSFESIFQGARVALANESNPMRFQQAAVSIRYAMERLSKELVGHKSKEEFSIDNEVELVIGSLGSRFGASHSGDQAELIADLKSELFSIAQHVRASSLTSGFNFQNLFVQLDPGFPSLPPDIRKNNIKKWRRCWSELSDLVHENHVGESKQVLGHLQYVETMVLHFLSPDVAHKVNRVSKLVGETSLRDPQDLFNEIKPLLENGIVANRFLRSISEPSWVGPLVEFGYFRTDEPTAQPSPSDQFHLELALEFLARALRSGDVPLDPVLSGLLHRLSDRASALLLEVLALSPASTIAESLDQFDNWGVRESRLIGAESLINLMEILLQDGMESEACKLARFFLVSRTKTSNSGKPSLGLPEWEFLKFLEYCHNRLPLKNDVNFIFADALEECWLSEFGVPGANYSSAIFHHISASHLMQYSDKAVYRLFAALLSRLQMSSKQSEGGLTQAVACLRGRSSSLFRRIEIQLRKDKLPSMIEESMQAALEMAKTWDEDSFEELVGLIRLASSYAPRDLLLQLEKEFQNTETTVEYPAEMVHHVVSELTNALQSQKSQKKKPHSEQIDSLKSPSQPLIRTGFWSGDNSPLTSQEMMDLGPQGLVSFLNSWVPPDTFPPQSIEAIAIEVENTLKNQPDFLEPVRNDLKRFPSLLNVFIRAQLTSLPTSNKERILGVLELIKDARQTIGCHVDEVSRFLRGILALPKQPLPMAGQLLVWEIILDLLRDYEPSLHDLGEVIRPEDFFQRAINNQLAVAFELGVLASIRFPKRSRNVGQWIESKSLILRKIETLDADLLDLASMIGRHLRYLSALEADWLQKVLKGMRLSKSESRGKAARDALVATYLNWGALDAAVLERWSQHFKPYLRDSSETQKDGLRFKLQVLVVEKILVLSLMGQIDTQSQWFTQISGAKSRAVLLEAAKKVAIALWATKKPSPVLQKRLAALWTWLVTRALTKKDLNAGLVAKMFASWFIASEVDPKWRLSQFRDSLVRAKPIDIPDVYSVMEEISNCAIEYPQESLELLLLVILKHSNSREITMATNSIEAILSTTGANVESENTMLLKDLKAQLGRIGYNDTNSI